MSALLASLVEIAVVLFALSSMLSVGVGHDWRHLIGPLRNTRAVIGALLANFVLVPLLMIGILPVTRQLFPWSWCLRSWGWPFSSRSRR
ncbi:MAG TPA: hypothetical protein VFB37_14130 [Steroidobacteraceae bacterium]|nr:hypothetical protein [Steroidobacteraceae bacterium]